MAHRTINKETRKWLWEQIKKENWQEIESFVGRNAYCWDLDGFSSKQEAQTYYKNFVTALKIRIYCRKIRQTTKKGTFFSTSAQQDNKLWWIMAPSPTEGSADGLRWKLWKIDQLRNIWIFF